MNSTSIAGIVFGCIIVLAILLWWWAHERRTEQQMPRVLQDHLISIGQTAKVEIDTKNPGSPKTLSGWYWNILGIVLIADRDIEAVEVLKKVEGVNNNTYKYLDYRFPIKPTDGVVKRKETSIRVKRQKLKGSSMIDLHCTGDPQLSIKLSQDEELKNAILMANFPSADIIPEEKQGVARIRTGYFLPTHEQFEVIDKIAKRVREVW